MLLTGLVLALMAMPASATALAAPGNSGATITGAFSDSCRDIVAISSKDISHVETGYVDGRVMKDEDINSGHFAADGDAGDEIDSVVVKSGTTEARFDCDSGPQAVCSDGIDNDGNGLIDYPADPGCSGPEDNDEGAD